MSLASQLSFSACRRDHHTSEWAVLDTIGDVESEGNQHLIYVKVPRDDALVFYRLDLKHSLMRSGGQYQQARGVDSAVDTPVDFGSRGGADITAEMPMIRRRME